MCMDSTDRPILKTNEPILMLIGTSRPRGKDKNGQLRGQEAKGQGHTRPFGSSRFSSFYSVCPRKNKANYCFFSVIKPAGSDGPPLPGTASPVVPRRLLRAGLHGSWSPASAVDGRYV